MGPLNDENMLQVDEMNNKSEKENFEKNNIINFKNIRYETIAWSMHWRIFFFRSLIKNL